MMNFRAGNDHSGLSSVQLGNLPFSTVALTDSYSLEYVAPTGMMNAMEGKSRFQIRITSRADNTPATGLDVSLMPMMYMATHEHSTPFEAVTDDDNDGTYDVTIYYLMPTSMMDGTSMGIWDLTVMIGGEVAHFYPDVMMAMGDSPRAVLKGQMVDDMIPNMSGLEEARSYYMFNEGVSATPGGHSFGLFLAARESMMNYPVVDVGATLNSGTAYELTVASISIEVSTDGSNWTAAVNDGGGHFSASGLSGMSSGVQAPLYARLSINGEQKTTDGNPPAGDGSNDIATFTVTPG